MRTLKVIGVIVACATGMGCSRASTPPTFETVSTTTITSEEVRLLAPPDEELARRSYRAVTAYAGLSSSARNVEIDVTEGIVTLRGSTSDRASKQALEDAVAAVPGVVTTLNKLELREATEEESDDRLAFEVQRLLLTDPVVARAAELVTIDVSGGVVTLRGTASTADAREHVERSVKAAPGVGNVANRLVARSH